MGLPEGGRRGRHPRRPGADRSRAAQSRLYRGQGAVRRPDGQASPRSRQCRRRRRPTDGAGRDHPARSDLCERDFERAAGAAKSAPISISAGSRPPTSSRFHSMSGYRTGPTFPITATSNLSRRSSTPPPGPSRCAAFCETPTATSCPGCSCGCGCRRDACGQGRPARARARDQRGSRRPLPYGRQ